MVNLRLAISFSKCKERPQVRDTPDQHSNLTNPLTLSGIEKKGS